MSVSKRTFKREWKLLQERFGTDHPPPVAARYYEFADRMLDEEAFVRGCRAAFVRERFFPRPADLMAAVAEDAWEDVLKAARTWSPHRSRDDLPTLSEVSWKAVSALGGLGGIGSSRQEEWRIRDRFVEEFVKAAGRMVDEPAEDGPLAVPPTDRRQDALPSGSSGAVVSTD